MAEPCSGPAVSQVPQTTGRASGGESGLGCHSNCVSTLCFELKMLLKLKENENWIHVESMAAGHQTHCLFAPLTKSIKTANMSFYKMTGSFQERIHVAIYIICGTIPPM